VAEEVTDAAPLLVRVKAIRSFGHRTERYKPGDTFMLDIETAQRWIEAKLVAEMAYGDDAEKR
jgi:hypothetical protein